MSHGYDAKTGFLFSLDRDFRFEGKAETPPEGAFLVPAGDEPRALAELVGCAFLSGCRDSFVAVRMDDITSEVFGLMGLLKGRARTFRAMRLAGAAEMAPPSMRGTVCLCGRLARDPAGAAEFCRMFRSSRVYVCPLVDELAAFGALVSGVRGAEQPRRVSFHAPDSRRMDGDSVEFDPKLEGDGLGRMAYHVSRGRPVVNQMMSGPGISPFYGRVLTDGMGGCGTYFVRSQDMDEFFPSEKLSVKLYGAMCVPMRVATSEKFRQATGYEGATADVMCVSDNVPGLPTFMGFYRGMTGKGFFGASDPAEIRQVEGRELVFRADRSYGVSLGEGGRLDIEGLL